MKKQHDGASHARGGVAVICFLTIIIGQAYLLRNIFRTDLFALPVVPWGIEFFFMLIFVAAIIYLFIEPMGWYTKIRLAIAFSLLIAYVGMTVFFYSEFQRVYLTGSSFEYASSAGGLVGLKLVLAVIAVTAGIPVAQPIDGREYARRLREKVEKNNAQLVKKTAAGAQKDLATTIKKLKATLSPEEMETFLQELRADSTASSSTAGSQASDTNESLAEKWRGWGGGT